MSTTPLTQLSSLFPKAADRCLACGVTAEYAKISVWIEHDAQDRPTHELVALCDKCGDRLVEPHPLLYDRVSPHQPVPGAMETCRGCLLNTGLRCSSPLLKANGGAGLPVKFAAPIQAFVDGTRSGRRAGWRETIYRAPPTCDGRQPLAQNDVTARDLNSEGPL
jgi:hypothetical protein